ncbi:MAG: hypothetical protein AAFQ87_12720 [Bacteroidota bacterium]
MKTFRLSLLLGILLMIGSSLSAQSQTAVWNDTMMVFKTPLELASGGKFLLGDQGAGFQFLKLNAMKAAPSSFVTAASLPRKVKISTGPVILKNQNGCFAFSCDKSCQSCRLVWYDRNGDGKVQPRKELRCVNAKGKVGRVSVSKVPCQ